MPASADVPNAPKEPTEILRNLSTLEEIEDRAYRRGRDTARVETRLSDHDRQLSEHKLLIETVVKEQRLGREALDGLTATVSQNTVVTASRAKDAREATERNLSTRTFVISLMLATTAVAAVVIAALALILGH